jgi:asparagine synthase (glutamine-hydrolysing)
MSGICGYFRFDGEQVEDQILANMLFLLERQGPDDQAYWRNGSIALGHTLLVTTRDSRNENQPATLGRNVWLTADARIDGRSELIAKMRAKGVMPEPSVTDDHLILHAYELWGPDCLDHLIGDFAFILWDAEHRRLFCATDQVGVSPLYFAELQNGFLVSNNLNAIRAHPEISNVLNEQAIGDYLMFRMNRSAESTTFRDIHKLAPGHSMSVIGGEVSVKQYWSIPEPEYERRSRAQYIEEFASLFNQSVSDRLRADAAGTHLSGGMDSTSITAILAQLKGEGEANSIEAYTHIPGFADLNIEQAFAEKVAAKAGVPMNLYTSVDDGYHSDIDDIADLSPEPSLSKRETPRFRMFSDSAQKSSTFFAGFGGDPLLLPVSSYWSELRGAGQIGAHISDAWQHTRIHGRPPRDMLPDWMKHRKKKRRGMSSWPLPEWLADDFVSRNDMVDRYNQFMGSAGVHANARIDMGTHPLWRRVFEWHSPSYSSLPMKVRFPFFDIRLIKWAQTVPPYPWLHRKYLLREIMRPHLPPEVLERPKTAFPVNPMLAKVEHTGAPDWKSILPDAGIIEDYVDIDALLRRLNTSKGMADRDTRSIVRVSSLGHWLDKTCGFDEYVRGSHARLPKYQLRQ